MIDTVDLHPSRILASKQDNKASKTHIRDLIKKAASAHVGHDAQQFAQAACSAANALAILENSKESE